MVKKRFNLSALIFNQVRSLCSCSVELCLVQRNIIANNIVETDLFFEICAKLFIMYTSKTKKNVKIEKENLDQGKRQSTFDLNWSVI